jgi:hypothetical protein
MNGLYAHYLLMSLLLDDSLALMAAKLFKYCVTLQPTPDELPGFMDFVVGDLIEAAKVHATHRFIIQGKKSHRIHALVRRK